MSENLKDMSGAKVLVTGAGGFIGSHLCERLAGLGAKVTALIKYNARSDIGNLAFSPPELRENMHIVGGNVEDAHFMLRLCEGQDYIFHLAALIGIPYSYAAPASYVRTNIEGTMNVLEAARVHKTRRVVHTSTSEVYGTAEYAPIDEAHPVKGQSPYSATKIGADKLAESYYRSFDLPVTTVRPFNTYGPRQSARAVIPTIIAQALEKDRIRLGSLSPQRDMTYVTDTAEGFIAGALAPGAEGMTVNLGTGETHTIGDIAETIFSCLGKKVDIETDEQRIRPEKSEVLKLVSDNALAREALGWSPAVSLRDGLEHTIAHMRANAHLYDTNSYTI